MQEHRDLIHNDPDLIEAFVDYLLFAYRRKGRTPIEQYVERAMQPDRRGFRPIARRNDVIRDLPHASYGIYTIERVLFKAWVRT